jgi:hypothetical protein
VVRVPTILNHPWKLFSCTLALTLTFLTVFLAVYFVLEMAGL